MTQVTDQRQPWLCQTIARHALRTAIDRVREKRPFSSMPLYAYQIIAIASGHCRKTIAIYQHVCAA